jgi:nitroreductase
MIDAMNIKSVFFISALFAVSGLNAQLYDSCVTSLVLRSYSERAYSSEAVTDQQLDLILKCGIKAPSARNSQPWKFTVIKDEPAMKDIIGNVVPGNVLIIVSGLESQTGTTPDFDCGLATQSMFIAAHSLGLGARIYSGPAGNVNSKKEIFGIPEGYKALAVLRIGNTDKSVDAISSATTRKNPEEIINFKE